MKAAIIGHGKMGREIEKILLERGHRIGAVIDEANASELDAAHLAGIDVALEFTTPDAAYGNIRACIDAGIPVVSGTTGWTNRLEELRSYCREKGGALFYASNYCLGVNLMFRLNRRQNTFEVILCEPNGAQRTIYDERSQQYVERVDDKTVTFIDGDRFLVRQEGHTGYMHLYLYSIRKGLLAQVTKGDWEVTDVVGTDGKRVWYLSTETSPLRRGLYSVRLDGKDTRRLTTGEGYYAIAPSAGMKYYISTFSNATPPSRVEVGDNVIENHGQPARITVVPDGTMTIQIGALKQTFSGETVADIALGHGENVVKVTGGGGVLRWNEEVM